MYFYVISQILDDSKYLLIAILILCSCAKTSVPSSSEKIEGPASWESLNSYPIQSGRTDDIFFISPQIGWAVNSTGALSKTNNGGENWAVQFRKESSFFRCLAFKDLLHGWIGTLGTGDKYLHSSDSITLYETHNGGEDWVPTQISGPYPSGLCGIQKVNDQVLVACGRVRGPSYFVKSTDGGKTWISKEMNHLAGSLVAPHFFDEENGLLLGGTTREKVNCKSLILSTTDGGDSWDTLYVSKSKGEYLWKASFRLRKLVISLFSKTTVGKVIF